MTDALGESTFREFAKRYHVHYTVGPELVVDGHGRRAVGFEIRLFAAHPKRSHVLPGGRGSRALAASLRDLAEFILPDCGTTARLELDPFSPALYESSEVPGGDEVALTIRLLHYSERYAEPIDPAEERCLKQIRAKLKSIRLPER
jgi:hypothetical protein